MDICDRCKRPAIEVAGRLQHAEYADAVFCSLVMVPAAAAPATPRADDEDREQCKRCGNDTFAVTYDPVAMGRNVACAGCGDSIGDLR